MLWSHWKHVELCSWYLQLCGWEVAIGMHIPVDIFLNLYLQLTHYTITVECAAILADNYDHSMLYSEWNMNMDAFIYGVTSHCYGLS